MRLIVQAQRGYHEDVGGCATIDEIARQIVSSGTPFAGEHPLRRRRAMVTISRIYVRASREKQIDDNSRPGEVERRLPIAAPLTNGRRISRQHPG
jgi:hypothetical protein